MSNFDRAIKALNDVDEAIDHLADNEAYVAALEAAGLLTPDLPDLPEPKPYNELAQFGDEEVMAARGTNKVRIYIDDSRMSSESARELALMLLAAADYAEKEQGNEDN